eukprot:12537911-Alexandrium_andersonii.AAC.1
MGVAAALPLCKLWDLVLGFVVRAGPTAPAVVPGHAGGKSKMTAGAAASVVARTPTWLNQGRHP